MPTGIPTAQDLDALNTKLRKAKADAVAKQKLAPRGYALQSVNTGQLERDLAKLDSLLGELVTLAAQKPAFAKQYANQIDAAKRIQQSAKDIIGNKTLLPFLSVFLTPILTSGLPLVEALRDAAKSFVLIPLRSINEQVSEVMKKIFVAGDLGPGSAAVKYAVQVDMPAHGGTADALRIYLTSNNGTVKAWYKTKFGLR